MAITTQVYDYSGFSQQLTAPINGTLTNAQFNESRRQSEYKRVSGVKEGRGNPLGQLIRMTKIQATAIEATTLTLQPTTSYVVITCNPQGTVGVNACFRIQLSTAERTFWGTGDSGMFIGARPARGYTSHLQFFVFPGGTLNIENIFAVTNQLFIYEYGEV